MRRLFLVATMLLCIVVVNAQDDEEYFDVGPYEVCYKGKGDHVYRIRKDVDLYKYFGLKKDTIIQVPEQKPELLDRGFQLTIFFETGTYRSSRYSMVYGIDVIWKQKVAKYVYFNGGLSFGYAAVSNDSLKEDIMEIGIPLSVEICNLNSKKASLYGGIGITPSFFLTMNAKYISSQTSIKPDVYNGLYIAPRLDFGVYIPVGTPIIKVGVSWRYKINCSGDDYDVYRNVIGRSFLGANLGVIF